jgi:acetylornithine deacetylase/succinyl-diaminopimelate desuccinylase-like protein
VDARVKEILARIDDAREDIAELALGLGNTFGPVGQEMRTAQAVHDWAQTNKLSSQLQEIIPNRANAVQTIRGWGEGPSLIFNAHLDTEASGPDYENLMAIPDPNTLGAWREGDRLFGHVVQNDRGCIAIMMIVGRALLESEFPLRGDVVLTSVAGETGQSPVDEYQGLRYEGKGFGSSYLVQHGVRADYALVAETSEFTPCWHGCGAAYYKVTIRGQNMYTPRLQRGTTLEEHPNAIVKAASVIQAIEQWAIAFEEKRSGSTVCGPVRPKAQVGAVRGGIPWRPNRSSPYCALYVDVRILPGEDVDDVTASLQASIHEVGVGAELQLTMVKPGAIGEGVEPLIDAVNDAHRVVRGRPAPTEAETAVVSMWRDINVFNSVGIPSLTFGPSRGKADVQGTGHFELDNLVDGAKMYALIALRIAGGLSTEDVLEDA